jgi:hypothetical protein
MSTTTTFKRIALVTVAALGFGLLSVAPSNAAVAADSLVVTDGTAVIGDSVTATSATATLSFIASAPTTDSHSVTVALVSAPAGNTLFPVLTLAETTAANVSIHTGGVESATGTKFASYTRVFVTAKGSAVASAKFNVYMGDPTANTGVVTAGTYVVRVTPAASPTAGTATAKDITIVVAAAAKATQAYTQLGLGTNQPAATALGLVDSVVAASKATVATTIVGKLAVSLRGASGAEIAESYTATITGAGTLGQGAPATTSTGGVVVGRSITMVHGNLVHIFADGTGGVGTITITNAAGAVLATKTVSFFGDPAAITLTVNHLLKVGTMSAGLTATVFDTNGYLVSGAQVYATSSDLTVVSNSYSKPSTTGAAGTVSIPLTGVKLGTAKITVGLASSATDVTTTGFAIKSDAATVTVAGGPSELAGVIVGMDKQSYAPGSFAWVTVTPVNNTGGLLSPDTYTVFASGGLTTSMPITAITPGITGTAVGTRAGDQSSSAVTAADPVRELSSTKYYKIQLPTTQGDFTLSWTSAAATNFPANIAAGGVAGSVTVSISDPGSQAAVDAAAEATDAANAATDAALAAADAADAATAAAEDASAAVATLSKSVTTALNNLKKQITALTALVNKLLKR